MGAAEFSVVAKGKTAREAFDAAVDQARWEHGHGGYTGTIAEKTSFRVFPVPPGLSARGFLILVRDDGDEAEEQYKRSVAQAKTIYEDKWGPALAIQIGPDEWLFCGLASS